MGAGLPPASLCCLACEGTQVGLWFAPFDLYIPLVSLSLLFIPSICLPSVYLCDQTSPRVIGFVLPLPCSAWCSPRSPGPRRDVPDVPCQGQHQGWGPHKHRILQRDGTPGRKPPALPVGLLPKAPGDALLIRECSQCCTRYLIHRP